MNLRLTSDSSMESLQLYVKLSLVTDFHFCDSNLVISLFCFQDDSHFVRVSDHFEEKTFWFVLDDFSYNISFLNLRNFLRRAYFRFLDSYRDAVLHDVLSTDLPF